MHYDATYIAWHFKQRIGYKKHGECCVVAHVDQVEVFFHACNLRVSKIAAVDVGQPSDAVSMPTIVIQSWTYR